MRRSANCVAARARVTPPHLRIDCATLSFFFFHGFRGAASEPGTFSLRSPNEVVCSARQGSNHRLMISHKCHSSRRTPHCRRFFRFSHSRLTLSPLLYPRTTFIDKIARRFSCSHARDNYTAKCGVHRWFWAGRNASVSASVDMRKMCLRVVARIVARRSIAAPNI